MRKILGFFFTLFSVIAWSQEDPVSWSTSVKKISEKEYDVVITASIKEEWHLYSIQEPPDMGPIPTQFTFDTAEGKLELVGGVVESTPITKYDNVFEIELSFFDKEATFTQRIKLLDPSVNVIRALVEYQACDDERCIFSDHEFAFNLEGNAVAVSDKTVDEKSEQLTAGLKLPLQNAELLSSTRVSTTNSGGMFGIFALGFLGGLLALLTPCVFPMIPLTVSFFTKQNANRSRGIRNAALYGFFIVLIYFLLSLPFHFLDSIQPEILNNISTNVWMNIFFFVIFVFFAFSFFGYYELTLPASWGNKMDSASNVGGLLGIFFMAITLAIVSFSCTGPILGGLLGSTALSQGDVAANLSMGMTGFGFALALPFALFALFPNWLNNLPKSGGWLNTVKVVLGFLELALAFKFLSNADLVSHWGLLKHEIFIGLWIIIFILMALYLFGKIRFPHDGPKSKPGKGRVITALVTVAFVVYLVAGLTKAGSLRLLSGFPPPEFYSIFEQESDCPLGLDCYKDFAKGLEVARDRNKPIMLDFTGWACVNCRKMEENVWSDPRVYNLLREKFVLISLYVDDRKPLDKEKQFNFELPNGRIKTIETIGDKWATFQTLNFQTASQPYYVLLSPELKLLNTPEQYTDKQTYIEWLETGLSNFQIGAASVFLK